MLKCKFCWCWRTCTCNALWIHKYLALDGSKWCISKLYYLYLYHLLVGGCRMGWEVGSSSIFILNNFHICYQYWSPLLIIDVDSNQCQISLIELILKCYFKPGSHLYEAAPNSSPRTALYECRLSSAGYRGGAIERTSVDSKC